MNKRKKVLILESNYHYVEMFKKEGFDMMFSWLKGPPDLICFTGGSDISTALYKEPPLAATSHVNKFRDSREHDIFERAKLAGIPMVGICRGAQLLCALNGGRLIQDVSGHLSSHNMETPAGDMMVTSSHHQMMYPFDVDHVLLGWSKGISGYYSINSGGNRSQQKMEDNVEPEVVFFPKTKSLCHQPHPEWCSPSSNETYLRYFIESIKIHLGVEL